MSSLPLDAKAPEVSETPLAYRAVRGGLWVALSSYWNIVFGFAVNILLTRLLPVEAFGTFALASFYVLLLQVQPKLGLNYAFANLRETKGDEVVTYFTLEMAATVLGFLLTLGAAVFLANLVLLNSIVSVVVALGAITILQGINTTFATLLDKELRFTLPSMLGMVILTVSYLPAVWLAFRGWGVWSLVAQNLTQSALSVIVGFWLLRQRLTYIWQRRQCFSLPLARHLVKFGLTTSVASFGANLTGTLDNFFVGTFLGVTTLGFYDRAYRLAQWPALLFNALNSRAALYTYAQLQDDRERLYKTATMLVWTIATVTVPLTVVIFIAAPDLLALLYGDRWLPSAPLLRLLIIACAVRPLLENAGSLFIAIGKPVLTTRFVLIQLAVFAISGLPLTLAFGVAGTCVAVGIGSAAALWIIYRNVSQAVLLRAGDTVVVPVIAAVLTIVGYIVLNRLTGLSELTVPLRVLIKGVYGGGMPFLLMLILQPRGTQERLGYVWRLLRGSEHRRIPVNTTRGVE